MRLHHFLAEAGIASRRSSELLIREGRVSVNGRRVRELPSFVDPGRDRIELGPHTFDDGPFEPSTTAVLDALTAAGAPATLLPQAIVAQWRESGWALIADEHVRLTPEGWLRLDALVASVADY